MNESVINLISKLDILNPNVDRVINNKKVADHHAIIPTNNAIKISDNKIPKNELNILKLIKMKLIAAVSLDYVYEQIVVKVMVEDKEFKASGKTEIEIGFKRIENEFKTSLKIESEKKEEKIVKLPKLNKNEKYFIKDVKRIEGFTSSPKHFTEDTLLSVMERAGNEDLDESLETEKKGLGTPATRASIIEKLIAVDYIKRSKKNLLITEKGIKLIKIIPEKIKSAQLTAEWENKLTEISIGKRNADEFIKDIENEVIELINSCADVESTDVFRVKKESIGNCTRCGSEVYEGNKNFYCSNSDCKFSMWKEDKFFINKKKTLTKTMAKKLLSTGKVKVKKLFSEKKDKYYEAIIVLNDTGTWVNYKLEFKK
jgi:DNA topoisomerase-3